MSCKSGNANLLIYNAKENLQSADTQLHVSTEPKKFTRLLTVFIAAKKCTRQTAKRIKIINTK